MTSADITKLIEKDFGWLNPIEKKKMYDNMIIVWNQCCDLSASFVRVEKKVVNDDSGSLDEVFANYDHYVSLNTKSRIIALKLK